MRNSATRSGRALDRVLLAEGLERRAALQQPDPFQVLAFARHPLRRIGHLRGTGRGSLSRRGGALQIATELEEFPALPVGHGRIGDAMKKVDAFADSSQEVVRRCVP